MESEPKQDRSDREHHLVGGGAFLTSDDDPRPLLEAVDRPLDSVWSATAIAAPSWVRCDPSMSRGSSRPAMPCRGRSFRPCRRSDNTRPSSNLLLKRVMNLEASRRTLRRYTLARSGRELPAACATSIAASPGGAAWLRDAGGHDPPSADRRGGVADGAHLARGGVLGLRRHVHGRGPEGVRVRPEYLDQGTGFVLDEAAGVAGFYILRHEAPEIDLHYLMVEPHLIGTGRGKRLWRHAVATAGSAARPS